MTGEEIKQHIPKRLFWDVDYSKLDFNKQKNFVIPRVMDRGMKEDVIFIWNYYGAETIKKVLLDARFLEDRTICYFSNKFAIKPESFRSFRIKQKNHPTWNL